MGHITIVVSTINHFIFCEKKCNFIYYKVCTNEGIAFFNRTFSLSNTQHVLHKTSIYIHSHRINLQILAFLHHISTFIYRTYRCCLQKIHHPCQTTLNIIEFVLCQETGISCCQFLKVQSCLLVGWKFSPTFHDCSQ